MKNHPKVLNDKPFMIELCIDHSVPLLCLLVDYFFNATPTVKRHLRVIVFVGFIYLMICMSVSFAAGKPLYPVLTFKDILSLIIVIVVFVMVVLLFRLIHCINKKKLAGYAKLR